MLAPLVMGYLANQKKRKGLDEAGLASLLGDERKAQEAKQPGLGGLAANLDANIMDVVVKMATGARGSSGAAKGGLGGLLGKILGR